MAINSIDDLLNLSDEELTKVDVDTLSESESEEETVDEPENSSTGDETTDSGEEQEEDFSTEEDDTESEDDLDETEEEGESDEENTEEGDETEEDDSEQEEDTDSTPEAELIEKILKNPIRANNRDIKIKNADEAVRLIQQGLGIQEKSKKLKPYMRHLRTLENAQLLDDNKINYVIDLLNNDKSAIMKLVKDANIDPLDLSDNSDPESNYVPKNHSVSEDRVQFEEQLDLIKSSPKSQETMSFIKDMDDTSFNLLKKDPRAIGVINNLMVNGQHDIIQGELDKAQLLNDPLVSGKSDLEAYLLVGAKLEQEGAFSNDPATSKPNSATKSTSTQNNRRKPDASKKKAAASNPGRSSSGSGKGKQPSLEDWENMSDEDFLKSL